MQINAFLYKYTYFSMKNNRNQFMANTVRFLLSHATSYTRMNSQDRRKHVSYWNLKWKNQTPSLDSSQNISTLSTEYFHVVCNAKYPV